MEGIILSRFLLLHWMVAFLLWKVVGCRVFVTTTDGILVTMEGSLLSSFFYTTMDCSLVIMEGSLLSRFFLFQLMVAWLIWKVVCCRYFCYSNGW